MSRLRFLADHDLNEHIVTGLKRLDAGIVFVRVREVGLADASDHDVLTYAAAEAMTVVWHDVNTMPSAASAVIGEGMTFPGLFLVRQTVPVRTVIDTLLLVWLASDPAEWTNQVVFLPL